MTSHVLHTKQLGWQSLPPRVYHEAPISIMSRVSRYTGGEYALVHLFDTYPEYYKYFEDAVAKGRNVILDNSLFELDAAFDPTIFHDYILKLKPTEYIIPDSFNNGAVTVMMAKQWFQMFPDTPGVSIGVVHGEDLEDAVWCYEQLSPLVDKIAFSFADEFYGDILASSCDKTHITGRQVLIDTLLSRGVLNQEQPVHLLGCTHVVEFMRYKNRKYKFIQSVDTSNPVMLALNSREYEPSLEGWDMKPEGKLVDYIDIPAESVDFDLVHRNIRYFREWA